jgi:uncharacterized protein YceK
MRRWTTLPTCVLCGLLLTACMTVDTRRDDQYDGTRVYSGTLADLQLIGVSFMEGSYHWFLASLMDLPFSLLADTLLLPVTIPEEAARSARSRASRPSATPSSCSRAACSCSSASTTT